ncbi:hypothetical protein KDC22_00985 [Paenibacillus tritici]|uniref:hypothetical protein n=1 Tax=Paenibacillus tritici TaxID=1873425 RepID=UPI001BA6EA37|nr:hypothetical protein [Paenibacillus tritici]QUL55201.1 hypothetical protein KDC22_00985 [Paenibacillus tritici]
MNKVIKREVVHMQSSDKLAELNNKMLLNYYVVFKSNNNDPLNFNPIVHLADVGMQYKETMHMLDPDLINIMPALHYAMHLPRIGFDVLDLDEETLLQSYDQPNNIIPIPSDFVNMINDFSMPLPTLIIYEEGCTESAKTLEKKLGSRLGIIGFDNLSTESLKKHWRMIWETINESDDKNVVNYESLQLYDANEIDILPLVFFSNQFGRLKKVINVVKSSEYAFGDIALIQFESHAILATWKEMLDEARKNSRNIDKSSFHKLLSKNRGRAQVPVVITMPGIAIPQVSRYGRSDKLPDVEKQMIKLLGTHRAIARNAIYIELDNMPRELFYELNQLEINCKHERGTNNRYIWRTLKKLGKILSNHLTGDQKDIILRASHITVFSDFPIGLAIFEEVSAPLCCYKSISYRPLTPLTRALQFEVPKMPYYYIGKRLKVIVAECLEKNDHIRKYSNAMCSTLQELSAKYETLDVVYKEVATIQELKRFLYDHRDAGCLVLSAHGKYDTKRNMAGLCIGGDVWMAEENDFIVPPIVLLSSCHVSPRGAGAVSVADLFLRSGAVAVLGTFIPVDVRRNSLLMVRLFLYIAETQIGNHSFKTLDEIWSFIISSNAINEIMDSNPPLKRWGMDVKQDGSFPLKDFQHIRSVGRLRHSHIYEDTMQVLREMLREEKLITYFEEIKHSDNFFPESLFYQLIGYPENIFIRNEVFEEASISNNL